MTLWTLAKSKFHCHFPKAVQIKTNYSDCEVLDIPDKATVHHDSYNDIYNLEDPTKFHLYNVPREHMDGGLK